MPNILCKKCNRSMDDSNFYMSRNLEKYPPNGKLDVCKKCLTMHVNNWEPTTFLNILQIIDVPYIETEWNMLLDKYAKDMTKVNGMTIVGRYLSKMKLKQFQNYSWADTEAIANEKKVAAELKQAQIEAQKNRYARAIDLSNINVEELTDEQLNSMTEEEINALYSQPDERPEDVDDWAPFHQSAIAKEKSAEDLISPKDRLYLTNRWGKLYRLEELLQLERTYIDMERSFDLQDASHKNYLMMICKTQLKMNQAIDCGDVDGFQKLSGVYDKLNKSAKFTAAQNKGESGEAVDSVGEIVYMCELEGHIPRYHDTEDKDIVDITLRDLKSYNYKLVVEEQGLGSMIEAALKAMEQEVEREEGELDEFDDILNPDNTTVLEDADFSDYYDEQENQLEQDEKLTKGVTEND